MDLLSRPVLSADYRIAYGDHPSQFGDLWVPEGEGPFPLVVFFHGGWWKSEYDLGYAGYMCDALKRAGVAVWSVEYRRVGATGGGWPGTFHDAATGFDFAATLAKLYPLDVSRVITMGHSAGGHLAFWIAGRHNIPVESELFSPTGNVALLAAVACAGAVDLRLTVELTPSDISTRDGDEVYCLMGGSAEDHPQRYQAGNPGDLLPLAAPQYLVQGAKDDQIPSDLPERWAKLTHSDATVVILPEAEHFDVVDPESRAWPVVLQIVQQIFGITAAGSP